MKRISKLIIILLSWPALCFSNNDIQDGPPRYTYINPDKIYNAIPRREPLAERGNPEVYEVFGQRYTILPTSKGYLKQGYASWYGTKFHGKLTSSGEPYNMFSMTAANKSLPIPCYVRVTNLENGKQIVVKVNDRGPFHSDRIIDLSYAAAMKLEMLGKGTAYVQVEALEPHQYFSPTLAKKITKTGRQLYLQLGAFGQLVNAREFAEQINKTIQEASVDVFKVQNELGTMYRVKIGPLTDELHAVAINDQLKQAGLSKGILLYL